MSEKGHMDQIDSPFKQLPWIIAAWLVYIMATLAFLPLVNGVLLRMVLSLVSPLVLLCVVACLPRSELKAQVTAFLRRGVLCSMLYSLLIAGGAVFVLLACSAAGYLPYSDRPGSGWGHVPAHIPRLDEAGYFLGWALILLPGGVLWGSLSFLFVAWSNWFGAQRWLVRILGALFCGVSSLFLADAAGWYIAIAAFPVYLIGILGVLFGAVFLPRFGGLRREGLPLWSRAVAIAGAALAFAATISFPY